jgi:hypothetical protein
VTAGSNLKYGTKVDVMAQSRSDDIERDRVPRNYGAASDRCIHEVECGNLHLEAEISSSVSRSTRSNRELELESDRTALLHGRPFPTPNPDSFDPRSLRDTDLSALVEQVETLNNEDKLYIPLERYLSHMTTRPGKWNIFTYKFQVTADKPIGSYAPSDQLSGIKLTKCCKMTSLRLALRPS